MSEKVNVEGKLIDRTLLLNYALAIARNSTIRDDIKGKDTLQERIDTHNAILDSIKEDHDSDWAREELHSYMGVFLMRPAVISYLGKQGIDHHDMISIMNSFFIGL